MKKVQWLVIMMLMVTNCFLYGQVAWTKHFKGSVDEQVLSVKVDANGNSFFAGTFYEDVSLEGTTVHSTTPGTGDLFLYKLDPSGKKLWAKYFFGPGEDGEIAIDLDANGNCYVTALFVNNITVDNVTYGSVVGGASFLAKVSSSGNVMWLNVIGNEYVNTFAGISVNSVGEVAIGGTFLGTIDFGGVIINNSLDGYKRHLYAAKYSTDGTLKWVKTVGAADLQDGVPFTVCIDALGAVYFTGTFTRSLSLDSFSLTGTPGRTTIFVAKISPSGNTRWIQQGFRKAPGQWNIYMPMASDVDLNGNVFVAGGFSSWVEFAGDTHTDNSTIESGGDIFLAKFDSTGTYQWSRTFGGNDYESIRSITAGRNNVISIAGSFGGKMTIGENILTATSGLSPFAAATDHDGNILYGFQFCKRVVGVFQGHDMDDVGNFLAGGYFYETFEDSDPVNEMVNDGGGMDGFGVKFNVHSLMNPGESTSIIGMDSVCVNETVALSVSPIDQAEKYQWSILAGLATSIITTNAPQLIIDPSVYKDNSFILIQVRGINSCFDGRFSGDLRVNLIKPFADILLKQECGYLKVESEAPVSWFKDNALIANETQNIIQLLPTEPGEFYVEASNFCGTKKSSTISAEPSNDDQLLINLITPNGDEKNQYFDLGDMGEGAQLLVVNRWGKVMFESFSYDNLWDAGDLSPGVYFYSIHTDCVDKKGTITVLK